MTTAPTENSAAAAGPRDKRRKRKTWSLQKGGHLLGVSSTETVSVNNTEVKYGKTTQESSPWTTPITNKNTKIEGGMYTAEFK